ncbi:hypothetical protein [Pelagivirga sediminicola]|nr:hypothetical protein [Pelagivirga sediminicola]
MSNDKQSDSKIPGAKPGQTADQKPGQGGDQKPGQTDADKSKSK